MTDKTRLATVREALTEASKELQPKHITCAADQDLGQLEADILLGHALKRERTWLFAHPEERLKTTDLKRFHALVARRKKHEPIAYILGEKEFYDLPFHVTRDTLIPRPDSELLVDLARKALFAEPSLQDLVWDVGTGSGAIAIAVATHTAPRRVLATDISPKALTVAKRNAKGLKTKNVTFLKANLLDAAVRRFLEKTKPSRLVIVANLPYLPSSDKKVLEPDVVKYEPSSALFVGQDGTDLIEKLLRQLAASDIHFASAFFEFDPPQATKLKKIARELFPQATLSIHKDLAGLNRVLEVTRSL